MSRQIEKGIENSILSYLSAIGIFAWKNQSVGIYDPTKKVFRKPMSRFQIKGVSDILGIFNGKLLAIEVKAPKGYPTPEQKEFIEMIKLKGGIAFVARSIDDVILALDRI